MKSTLLSRIIFSCQHQFSWPRRDENGGYYQLCVNCGSKYRYDWKTMRRTSRVEDDLPAQTRQAHRVEKITWKVRERRLKHVVPVLYRVNGTDEWIEATSENLSRSGLLFRTEQELALCTLIDIRLEMPEELTGEWAPEVTLRGMVARVTPFPTKAKGAASFLVGCAVEQMDFAKKPAESAPMQAGLH